MKTLAGSDFLNYAKLYRKKFTEVAKLLSKIHIIQIINLDISPMSI
jgi:hypothetical protein